MTPVRPERGTLSLCGFSGHQQPLRLQVRQHALPGFEPVESPGMPPVRSPLILASSVRMLIIARP